MRKGKRRTKSYRDHRDRQVYREYMGINPDKVRVPATVLATRYNMSRARVYQILKEQYDKSLQQNARAKLAEQGKLPDTEKDAAKVAELLSDMLGGQ